MREFEPRPPHFITMNRIKNPELEKLIADLKTLSATKKSQLWKRIALDLERPTRQRRVVNVYKIDKYALENEVVTSISTASRNY